MLVETERLPEPARLPADDVKLRNQLHNELCSAARRRRWWLTQEIRCSGGPLGIRLRAGRSRRVKEIRRDPSGQLRCRHVRHAASGSCGRARASEPAKRRVQRASPRRRSRARPSRRSTVARLKPMSDSLLSELLTSKQVAELLQMKRTTVEDYARRGLLPSLKLGRHRRFVRSDVESALVALRNASQQ